MRNPEGTANNNFAGRGDSPHLLEQAITSGYSIFHRRSSGGRGALFLIAGPCVIESEAHALKMAEAIASIARDKKLPYIFKASYDKANRTSIRSFRGPGLDEGLRILQGARCVGFRY